MNNSNQVVLLGCGGSPTCPAILAFLERHYKVIHCQDCEEIPVIAGRLLPDLILLAADPRCTGIEVCAQLRRSLFSRRPAAIILFGAENDDLIDQAFAAGADEYVREPLHWKLLAYRINFLIQKRRSELELSDFARRLEQTNRELKDFTYVVSHDLQEPLHLIRAFAERITTRSRSILDEQGTLYLARIIKATCRMQSLIDGLLQYSRLTTQAREFTPVDLSEVVREVVSDLEARIEQIQAAIKIGELGVVEADPIQMRQLFQNLVSNALKYSSCTVPPQIEVFPVTMHGEEVSGMCRIVVKDNGIGFDACFQEQIFGLFQRLHGRDEYNGTGIGLAICKKIVERHGGDIAARSSSGKGAEFIVTLPLRQKKN